MLRVATLRGNATKLIHAFVVTSLMTLAASATAQEATFTLPGTNVYPESAALDPTTGTFYVGNTEDGTVYRGSATAPGELEVFLPARTDGRSVVMGMALDAQRRLFLAGGATRRAFVYDANTGDLIRALELPGEGRALVNDVVVTEDAAYFTDSFRPTLYRVPLTATSVGEVEPWLDFAGTPLRYGEGNNLDGIVASADGRVLVAVQPSTGQLYRIDTETKEVSRVALSSSIATGNGLLLDGQILYIVNDEGNEVIPVTLAADFSSGEVGEGFSNPSLSFPTAAVKDGERLLVVNHQRGTVTLPFTVSSLAIP